MEAGQNIASPAAAPEVEAKPQSFFSRLSGVIFSPSETFVEIGRAPRVLIPLLCLALLGAAVRFVVVNRYGYENMMRKTMELQFGAMEKFGAPPAVIEQARTQAEEQLKPEKLARRKMWDTASSTIGFPLIVLIVTGIFKLFSLILGAKNRFKGVLSAVSFAYLAVGIVYFVIVTISVYLKNPEDIDVFNPVASNIGALMTMAGVGSSKFLTGLASWIDIFGIWRIALLSIGCAAVTTKMKAGVASIPHVLLYLISAVILSFLAGLGG
jgi:hypothetical protein